MQVLKFGGTSVADSTNIRKVISIIASAIKKETTIVVVSALGGITDILIEAGNLAAKRDTRYQGKIKVFEDRHSEVVMELIPIEGQTMLLNLIRKNCIEVESICKAVFLLKELSARTLDSIVSHGELLSSGIIAEAFRLKGESCLWLDSRELIQTNSNYGLAVPDQTATQRSILAFIRENPANLYIAPGFIASDREGITTTMGRGGSDYSAAIYAAATDAGSLEIWTDVSGIMTADPRIVNNARTIPYISYKEAMELSHFGAKVIYPPTLQPLLSKNTPVWIKNTFSPGDFGTLIENDVSENNNIVRGISSMNKISLLSLEGSGMIGIPGFSRRLFGALAEKKINIILITQGSSEHTICVGIDESNTDMAKKTVDDEFNAEIAAQIVEPLQVESGLSIIALVGDNMRNHPGISGKMFGALGRNSVNIRAIAQGSSEKNISAVVNASDVSKAINVLHEEFFEEVKKQINLFIAGVGNVGGKLLDQINKQKNLLQKKHNLHLRIIGIASSRKMLLDEKGIETDDWRDRLAEGTVMDAERFFDFIIRKNMRNSVFVDVTSSSVITDFYKILLQKSIAVVACNKISASSPYKNYAGLKTLAREYNTSWLFETNVGAGLPIIGTLNDLIRSGDRIQRIEAVLSGTLNFVFNNYDTTHSFAKVVRQAQDEGYAEPDPRIDLCGTDVMRKILILAREAGYHMEMEDIKVNPFLPDTCLKGDVADFYSEMEAQEVHFRRLYQEAKAKDCKLKFVAKLNEGIAEVGLQHIGKDNDLYHLYGKDNVVLFHTDRYNQQPLVIKGAGAGAEVTASGIFADIMRAARI